MEVVYGFRCQPCGDGSTYAGRARDLSGYPARDRSGYPAGRICRVSVSRQPLGLGVGHRLDMGATGSGARIAWRCFRMRRSEVGH